VTSLLRHIVFILFTSNNFLNKSFDMGRITNDDRCLIMGLRTENCFAR